jgi:hypothetical protein
VVMCSMSSSEETRRCFSSRSRARTVRKGVAWHGDKDKCGCSGERQRVRTEEGEHVGVVFEIVGVDADEVLGEVADGGLDGALGLDGGDGEGGDEGECAEDDETDECGGKHAGGDLGSPMVEDRLGVFCLAELEVVFEPTAADDVERGGGGPVDEIEKDGWGCGFLRIV